MKIQDMRFRKIDLARITGIKPRTILDWTQKGYLVPIERVEGQGKTSYYSLANAMQAKVLEKLTSHGMSLKNFGYISKFTYNERWFESSCLENEQYNLIIINDCEKVFNISYLASVFDNDPLFQVEEYRKIRKDGKYEYILIINLKKIIFEIKEKITNL